MNEPRDPRGETVGVCPLCNERSHGGWEVHTEMCCRLRQLEERVKALDADDEINHATIRERLRLLDERLKPLEVASIRAEAAALGEPLLAYPFRWNEASMNQFVKEEESAMNEDNSYWCSECGARVSVTEPCTHRLPGPAVLAGSEPGPCEGAIALGNGASVTERGEIALGADGATVLRFFPDGRIVYRGRRIFSDELLVAGLRDWIEKCMAGGVGGELGALGALDRITNWIAEQREAILEKGKTLTISERENLSLMKELRVAIEDLSRRYNSRGETIERMSAELVSMRDTFRQILEQSPSEAVRVLATKALYA